ncbi:MAG: hypothetical protein ABI614_25210, partial [Planctomycetota bacterium]
MSILSEKPRTRSRHATSSTFGRTRQRKLLFESLEDRRLLAISDPLNNFPGINAGFTPPDTVMDVGPNHIIQMTNSTPFQIWDKPGNSLAAPTNFGSLWTTTNPQITPDATNNCQANLGDPIVVYDHLADRWVLSQFFRQAANTAPFGICIAVSQTADPVGGVNGTAGDGDEWFLYRFDTNAFPDYPKFGVWPDGYYVSTYESPNLGIYVFDRAKMLVGDSTSTVVMTQISALDSPGTRRDTRILPADVDGPAPPLGTPNYFVRTVDDNQHLADPRDRVEIYEAIPDFVGGTLAFNLIEDLDTVAGLEPFTVMECDRNSLPAPVNPGDPSPVRDCIPQPDTEDTIDALSNRPMMQLKYRNFGTHQAMVLTQTVDVQDVIDAETPYTPGDEVAGLRWYELRTDDGGTNWAFEQQGDYTPQPVGLASDDEILHRWMGSAAIDKDGNIAIGYSITNSDDDNGDEVYAGIRYAGRRFDDAPGELPQGEKVLLNGTTFQGNTDGNLQPQRWGDYSALTIDPVDDCTFWFSTHVATGVTQIGSFRFDTCRASDPYEPKDVIADATILGSLPKVTLRNATINDENDIDFYKYTAADTGKLIINAFTATEHNLQIRVRDRFNNIVATGTSVIELPGLKRIGVVIP